MQNKPLICERALVIAAACAMTVAIGLYAFRAAPTIPVFDGWLWISQLRAFDVAGFLPAVWEFGFRAQEHIYLIPSLAFLATASIFDGSYRPFALTSFALLVVLGLLFYRLARSLGTGPLAALLAFLVVVSFRQYHNVLFGFQFGLVLSLVAGVIAIDVADRYRSPRGLAGAIALGVLASFSSGAGIFALGLVLAVRATEWRRRSALVVAATYAIFVGLLGLALYLDATQRPHFLGRIFAELRARPVAQVIVDWVDIVGGGVAVGGAATLVGLVVLCSVAWNVAVDVRQHRRLHALPAIALFSLVSTLAIACIRSPIYDLASRWAVFAAPAIVAVIIWSSRALSSRSLQRGLIVSLTGAFAVWLAANQYVEAVGYAKQLDPWALRVRTDLASLRAGEPITNEQLRQDRINPTLPNAIGTIARYYVERFPDRVTSDDQVALVQGLPQSVAWQARLTPDGDGLALTGHGYAYKHVECTFPSGCHVQLVAELSASGAGTLGIIVRESGGNERNVNRPLPDDGAFHVQTIAVDVANGDGVDPYVFSTSESDRVRIRSFGIVVSRIPQKSP